MTDIDMIVAWRADRRPIVVTAAQQAIIRTLFAGGASDGEIAAAVADLPPLAIGRIRAAMTLVRRALPGGHSSTGAPKHLDGLPRMIVSEETLINAYRGRRYGP